MSTNFARRVSPQGNLKTHMQKHERQLGYRGAQTWLPVVPTGYAAASAAVAVVVVAPPM